MTQLVINVGASPNDGQGDPIRTAYQKCNTNFSELYSRVQTSPPSTPIGVIGDSAGMYAYDSNYFYYCYGNYDGSSAIWGQIADVGNITGIENGTSNVSINSTNGNVTVGVSGTANIGVFTNTSFLVAGRVSATGNIVGANLFTDGNVASTGQVIASGNITGNNINSTSTFSLAVFANATVRDSSITSPVPGMMIYVTGTGMQVRGATAWNTVAGTGT